MYIVNRYKYYNPCVHLQFNDCTILELFQSFSFTQHSKLSVSITQHFKIIFFHLYNIFLTYMDLFWGNILVFGWKITIFENCVLFNRVFGGNSIFTSEVYTVLKVEYFLYIIQIMLQYAPSFNKVWYALRLQGCFL